MLINTRATFDKILTDFKRFSYTLSIILNLVYIATSVYALVFNVGNTFVNAVVCAGAVFYFVFYLVTYWDKTKKKEKKDVKKAYAWFRILMDAFGLGITVYGVYVASARVTVVSILLAALSGLSWLFKLTTTLLIEYVEGQKELIIAALAKDFAFAIEPANKVQNVIRKIKGEEPKEPKTVSEALEKRINKIREDFISRKEKSEK
ncbi:MAG: hypothetical protein E7612_07350 [Ruminococcaceae bacterium]|nr:hypothetical protein [Oscillospiraceae bacterium]